VRKLESRSKRLLTSGKQDAAMELDSPPLALKLDMLDRVSAAVKGKITFKNCSQQSGNYMYHLITY
jgi:hypothetical protein